MRGIARAKKKIECASCSKRIRAHEPDLMLEDLGGAGGKPRFYHERCQGAAYAAAMERPGVYVLTVRSVDAAKN